MKLGMPEKRACTRILVRCIVVVAASVVAAWGIYLLLGHWTIARLYAGDQGAWRVVRDGLMAGRLESRLDDYIARADTFMLDTTLKGFALISLLMMAAAAIRRPSIAACAAVLLPMLSVGLFVLLEV